MDFRSPLYVLLSEMTMLSELKNLIEQQKRDQGAPILSGDCTWIQGADLIRVEFADKGDGLEILKTEWWKFEQLESHQRHDDVLQNFNQRQIKTRILILNIWNPDSYQYNDFRMVDFGRFSNGVRFSNGSLAWSILYINIIFIYANPVNFVFVWVLVT